MKIEKLRTNHLSDPLGYQMDRPVFSWVVAESTGKKQKAARVRVAADEEMREVLCDTGLREDLSSLAVPADLSLAPRARYYWNVEIVADDGDRGVSQTAWFEIGKRGEPWQGKWIRAPFDGHSVFTKAFVLDKSLIRARLYICGLGLYEAALNGMKIGDEFLAPGCDSYQYQIQYQTYDVTAQLCEGDNQICVMLGKGWYAGRYGFGDRLDKLYVENMQLLAELRVEYADGTETVIGTDENWRCKPSPVVDANIYDGEKWDARVGKGDNQVSAILADAPQGRLVERLAPPVKVMQTFTDYDLLHTPAGELVLDFRQDMAGWVTFTCDLPEGGEVRLQYGELLQNDCFYRDNLRTAEAAYSYISDGNAAAARPHFTYYGFRGGAV